MLENGIDIQRFTATPWPAPPGRHQPLRVLFVGRLIAAKGVSMLLRAVANLRQRAAVELRIVGDGPMGDAWKVEAAAMGLVEDCRFLGALPLDAVAEQMRWAHVLCLPSVRESGGGVLLEAMACGRPVIGMDFGGPAELIDDEVGALLPLTTPTIVAADLEGTLAEIVRRPDLWRARGLAARDRALARFDWESKIDAALRIYREVLDDGGA
jgi:glycosyltransferase involved in cell wall biosynthesis